jgi:UDP-4-amino-4,6-dideoxy-N-acetyl-beta-L-altrosamine N-acetyltransferase
MGKEIKELVYENIRLTPLKLEHLPRILTMRNSDEIRELMVYQQVITMDEHLKWYKRISESDTNYYWSILVDGESIGLVNIKDIDWKNRTGEGGLFIGDTKYQNSMISFIANILVLDFAFSNIGLKNVNCTILNSNTRAVKFNLAFGFEIVDSIEICHEISNKKDSKLSATLQLGDYLSKRDEIIKIFIFRLKIS